MAVFFVAQIVPAVARGRHLGHDMVGEDVFVSERLVGLGYMGQHKNVICAKLIDSLSHDWLSIPAQSATSHKSLRETCGGRIW